MDKFACPNCGRIVGSIELRERTDSYGNLCVSKFLSIDLNGSTVNLNGGAEIKCQCGVRLVWHRRKEKIIYAGKTPPSVFTPRLP